jgi:hypothetical protein
MSALVITVTFNPVRHRIQHFVDRYVSPAENIAAGQPGKDSSFGECTSCNKGGKLLLLRMQWRGVCSALRPKKERVRRVSGRLRSTMRLGWGVLVGLSLGLFVLSVPARYAELAQVARRASTQLGAGDDLLRSLLSQGVYAFTVLSLEVAFVLAFVLTFALICAAVVWHNSSDWRALFFSAVLVTYSVWVTPTLDTLTLPFSVQTVADLTQAAGVLMAVSFFLLFPDGRFVPGWTRLIALGWAVYCLAWGLFPAAPLSLIDPFEASFAAFLVLMVLGWTLGLVAQAVRYRRAGPRQRVQTKWVMLVIAGACVGYAAVYLPGVFLPTSGSARLLYDLFGVPVFLLLALPIPIAIITAVLRHHLFDARLIINRTLVYGALTVVLAGLFEVTDAALEHLMVALTRQDSLPGSIMSALVITVTFNPVRHRIQHFVDRYVSPEESHPAL